MTGRENRVNLGRLREQLRGTCILIIKMVAWYRGQTLEEIVDDVRRLMLVPDEVSGTLGEAGTLLAWALLKWAVYSLFLSV